MNTHALALALSLLLTANHVTSFTIISRHDGSTDLAEALAVLQRQRRRVGASYLGPENVLNGRPLAVEDIQNWLSTSDADDESSESDLDTDWISDGHLEDVKFLLRHFVHSDNKPLIPLSVETSRQELEDIFDTFDRDGYRPGHRLITENGHDQKMKDETANVKGVMQKKTVSPEINEPVVVANNGLSLNTLTKEEFKVLMKAVEKLRKQSIKFDEKTIETPEAKVTMVEALENNGVPKSVTIVQPASKEEVESVFDAGETPVVKETEVIVEKTPDSSVERIIEKQVISNALPKAANSIKNADIDLINELASDLQDSIAEETEKEINEEMKQDFGKANNLRNIAENEKDWQMQMYDIQNPSLERNTKRAVPALIKDLLTDDVANARNSESNAIIEDLDHDLLPPTLEKFVAKILKLQDEISRLKMVAQLEDLENDVLTDALNEASLGQAEGTVSEMEFESLQQAIKIEEALQDLRRSRYSKHSSVDATKLREPWRPKRNPHFENGNGVVIDDSLHSKIQVPSSVSGRRVTKDDLQRLLGQTYLMKDQEAKEYEPEVVSDLTFSADVCPALQDLSKVCEWSDLYSLPIDVKAKSICELTEMCCGCGDTFHVGQEKCDLVYQATTSASCQEKETCDVESEIIRRALKLVNQRVPLLTSRDRAHVQPSFWACSKRQQLDGWICGKCHSAQRGGGN